LFLTGTQQIPAGVWGQYIQNPMPSLETPVSINES
jgi:hypothetical protein